MYEIGYENAIQHYLPLCPEWCVKCAVVGCPKPLVFFTFTFLEGKAKPPGPGSHNIVQDLSNILQISLLVHGAWLHQIATDLLASCLRLLGGKTLLVGEGKDASKNPCSHPTIRALMGCWHGWHGWHSRRQPWAVLSLALAHCLDGLSVKINLKARDVLPDQLAVVAESHDHTVVRVPNINVRSPDVRVDCRVNISTVRVAPSPMALTG